MISENDLVLALTALEIAKHDVRTARGILRDECGWRLIKASEVLSAAIAFKERLENKSAL